MERPRIHNLITLSLRLTFPRSRKKEKKDQEKVILVLERNGVIARKLTPAKVRYFSFPATPESSSYLVRGENRL